MNHMTIWESRGQSRWLVLYQCDGLYSTTYSGSSGDQLPADVLINWIHYHVRRSKKILFWVTPVASGAQVVVMNPLKTLASPKRNLQNFRDKHASQAGINIVRHLLLNPRGWKQLVSKNVCISKMFRALLQSALCSSKCWVCVVLTKPIFMIERTLIIHVYFKKVKWSRYRPGVAQRVGRGIAVLFRDRGTRRGWVVSSTPRPYFNPGERPGI